MLDVFNLPSSTITNQQIFNAQTPTVGTSWQVWNKPRGCNFVHILMIGAGGGGAGGVAGAAGVGRGGAGGGSGAVASVIIPSFMLPDVLFVSVGKGGTGGAPTGGNGIASYVCINPDTTAQNVLLFAGAGGGSVTAGTGGTAGGATAIASLPLIGIGVLVRPEPVRLLVLLVQQ